MNLLIIELCDVLQILFHPRKWRFALNLIENVHLDDAEINAAGQQYVFHILRGSPHQPSAIIGFHFGLRPAQLPYRWCRRCFLKRSQRDPYWPEAAFEVAPALPGPSGEAWA